MPSSQKVPERTAITLGKFAAELKEEGFTEDQVTKLLVVALTSELRTDELMLR